MAARVPAFIGGPRLALVLLLHGREVALASQRREQARVHVILHLLAAAGELRQDVPDARLGNFDVGRRLRLEVVVGDVEDFQIGDLEFLGQHGFRAPLVAEREIIAFDRSLQESDEHIAPAGDVASPHHDRAEHPRNLLGHEIDENVDARLASGSLSGVALISPDFTASRRRMPPPDSFNVTSLRVRPSRASASVTVESLSEPNVLTPITPPLSSAAVFTPGAEKKVKRMTLLKEPIVRISPPLRLIRITEDNPTCMTSSRPACSSAAPRLPPLMLMMSTLSPWAA